jgi:peroxiredoxin
MLAMETLTAQRSQPPELADVLREFQTESGRTLLEVTDQGPVLLLFLRHFGCAFCRQTLDQVSAIREQIAARGVSPVFVHLGTPERAKPFFDYYKLEDVERVSNPEGTLYRHAVFHLDRQPIWRHFVTPKVLAAWLGGTLRRYGLGKVEEDGEQMPGVFVLKDRRIVNVFRYRTIADEPDYLKLIS